MEIRNLGNGRVIRIPTPRKSEPLPEQSIGSNNMSPAANLAILNAEYDIIVGSSANVQAGTATHTTITDAIAAASAGGSILIRKGTYTENVTVNKKLRIAGCGHGTSIVGNWVFDSASDYSEVEDLRVQGNITFNSGADGIFMYKCWMSSGGTLTDNGSGNSKIIIQE